MVAPKRIVEILSFCYMCIVETVSLSRSKIDVFLKTKYFLYREGKAMKYYTPYPILLDFLLVMRTEYEIDYDGSQGSFYSSENRPGFLFTSINRFFSTVRRN